MDSSISLIRTEAPALTGETLSEANVRSRTGCTVVAVERDGERFTVVDPDFRFREDDVLVLAGTDEGTTRFLDLFC